MSNYDWLIIFLEAALVISCSLVIYCVYLINKLSEKKVVQSDQLQQNEDEIENLKGNLSHVSQTMETLLRTEQEFAMYRQRAKAFMDKAKELQQSYGRVRADLRRERLLNQKLQRQYALLQAEQARRSSRSETEASEDASTSHPMDELRNRANKLQEKAEYLEERLQQTLVEKKFIEKKFVEIDSQTSASDDELTTATTPAISLLEQTSSGLTMQ